MINAMNQSAPRISWVIAAPEIGMPPAVYALSRDPAIIVAGVLTLLVNGCWPLGEALINGQRNHQSSRLCSDVEQDERRPRQRHRQTAARRDCGLCQGKRF